MNGAADRHEDAADSASPSRRPSRLQTVVAALVVVAVVVSATFWATGGDPFAVFDSGPEPCAVETEPGTLEAAAPAVVRQNLSAEPVMRWTQVDVPGRDIEFHELSSGLVAARVDDEGHKRVLYTSNGIDWEELPTPADIAPRLVQHAGNRWVIAGREIRAPTPATEREEAGIERLLDDEGRFPLGRVATSTDDGETWKEVPIDTQTPPHFKEKYFGRLELMVIEDRIVFATLVRPEIDLNEALTSRGLLEENEVAYGLPRVDGEFAVAIRRRGTGVVARWIDVPVEELDLTERDLELVDWWKSLLSRQADRLGYVRVYGGDSRGLELAAEYDSERVFGAAAPDAFFLAVRQEDPDGVLYVGSRNGRDWDEMFSAGSWNGQPLPGVTAARDAWAMIPDGGRREILMSIDCGRAPEPVAAFTPPEPEGRWLSWTAVHAGPAGLFAIDSRRSLETSAQYPGNTAGTHRVLWSPDGRTWSLLHVPEVPPADDPHPSIDLAIGENFVLATVKAQGMNPVWFVAEVP